MFKLVSTCESSNFNSYSGRITCCISVAYNQFTCHWSYSYLLVTVISDRAVQDSWVSFNQELYLKAFEIVSAMKIRIFVRLGGPHQLMCFIGSIGKVIKGSGLGTALDTIYTSVTINPMLIGKTYTRAVRGHLICASATQLTLLKQFWHSSTSDQQNELKNIYDWEDPWLLQTMAFRLN